MDNELIDLLRTVANGFRARMQAKVVAADPGLTAFQARLVNVIGRNEGVSQLELGALVERDKAQIARAIKDLEAQGLVTRSADIADWRTKCVALTPEGRQAHTRLNSMREQLAADVLARFSNEEKHALRSGLEKMDAALREQAS